MLEDAAGMRWCVTCTIALGSEELS
jgi:hypothetical protein